MLRADGHNAGISSSAQPASTTLKKLPHFTIDLNADGVQLFQNSEKNECIPIMMVVHSVKESAFSDAPPIILKTQFPVIIGIAHGRGKPRKQILKSSNEIAS